MTTKTQIEEIKLRLKNARAAAFKASHSDYPADRESSAAELTAAIDAYTAATDPEPDPVALTIAMGKEWLAYCPAHPGRTAPNLLGWHGPVGYVCVHCCGRLSGGGHNLRLFCATPLWVDQGYNTSECTCQLCGRTLTN